MKEKSDKEHFIPVFDCSSCGKKDMPANHTGPLVKWIRDKLGRFKNRLEIHIWSCPNCDKVLNFEEDFKPKEYVSITELGTMGWKKK